MKTRLHLARAFTLIELLVVISIISVLIAVMLPSLKAARETAQSVKCQASMKQFGFAWHNYANDWRGTIPGNLYGWGRNKNYYPYLGVNTKILAAKQVACPTNPFRADSWCQQYNYWADGMINLGNIRSPADAFWACETPVQNGSASYTIAVAATATPAMWFGHPNENANLLFFDGHSASRTENDIPVLNDTGSYRHPGYNKFWRSFLNNRFITGFPFSGVSADPWI